MITKSIKRCLVTGGAGFIGSHLTQRLLDEGCEVVVIDDLSEGSWKNLPKHPNLKNYKVSILDNVSKYVKGVDVIFHLAALPRLQRSIDNPLETHKVNVLGTLNLLMEAKKNKIKKFVFSSSSSVYGDQKKLPFREDMIPKPLVPYALQKAAAEEYCRLFWRIWKVPTISLRYFNVYGPGMNPNGIYATLIPKVIKSLSQDESPVIYGDGKQTRDFTFVTDVVEANILAAKSNMSGEVFNIGFGKPTQVNQVVSLITKLMGKDIKPKYEPPRIESRHSTANNLKARKLLGWRPSVSLSEGLKKMVQPEGIVGHGDMASVLTSRKGLIFFASGVSNSQEKRESEYEREKKLLLSQDKNKHLVYFGSLAIFYNPDTRYSRHKKQMEDLIKKHFKRYTIIRLGNITWGNNPHTLINFMRSQASQGKKLIIQDTYRYLVEKDEFLHWINLIPKWNSEINIPGKRLKVQEIVKKYVLPSRKRR